MLLLSSVMLTCISGLVIDVCAWLMKHPESAVYWPEKWRACRIRTDCVMDKLGWCVDSKSHLSSFSSSWSPPPPRHPPADAGEAEGGQQTEYAPAAECWAQRSAAESSGGRRCRHQNPGGGASAASAEGEQEKWSSLRLLSGRWCLSWQSWGLLDWQEVKVTVEYWVMVRFFFFFFVLAIIPSIIMAVVETHMSKLHFQSILKKSLIPSLQDKHTYTAWWAYSNWHAGSKFAIFSKTLSVSWTHKTSKCVECHSHVNTTCTSIWSFSVWMHISVILGSFTHLLKWKSNLIIDCPLWCSYDWHACVCRWKA